MLARVLTITAAVWLANARPMRVKYLSVGGEHNCAILETLETKCWGGNKDGHLGLEDQEPRGDHPGEMGDNLPAVDLGTGRYAVALSTGDAHGCAILDNGVAKCWGKGQSGALGYEDENGRGGAPGEMGDNLPALNLGAGLVAEELVSGEHHTCAVLDDKKMKCWGANIQGQLGIGSHLNRGGTAGDMGDNLPFVDVGTGRFVEWVTAGDYHTCAHLDNGDMKCFGSNQMGQSAAGRDENGKPLIQVGAHPHDMGDNLEPIPLGTGRTVKHITAGFYHTCAILDNDDLKCWGLDNGGQLGQESPKFFVGKDPDHNDMGDNLPPVNLGTGLYAVEVSCGSQFTCVRVNTNQVKCFGKGDHGELGYESKDMSRGKKPGEMGDNLPFVDLGAGHTALHIASGDHHTCVILEDETVKCWGKNHYGSLGLEDEENRGLDEGTMGDALPIVDLGSFPDFSTTTTTSSTATTLTTTTITTTSITITTITTTTPDERTAVATDQNDTLGFTVDRYPPDCPVKIASVQPGSWAAANGMVKGDTLRVINGKDVCQMTKDEFLGLTQGTRPLAMTFHKCSDGAACNNAPPAMLPVDKDPSYVAPITTGDDRLGFTVDKYPPDCPVRVRGVESGSWAERSGLSEGDTVKTIGGKDVCNMTKDEFLGLLRNQRPVNVTLDKCKDFGNPTKCKVDGPAFPVDKPILAANATGDQQTLDFTVDTYPPSCPVRVATVTEGGWADRVGMGVGDKLKTINGKDVCNMTKDEFLGLTQDTRPLNFTFEDCLDGPECAVNGPALPVDDPPHIATIGPDEDRLGFTVSDYPPSCPIRLQNVDKGSWAERAGLGEGDQLMNVGGKNICNMTPDDFLDMMRNTRPLNVTYKKCHDFGDPTNCAVDGKDLPVDRLIKSANATKDDQTLDFSVDKFPPDCPVRVSEVTPGGWADRSGIEEGDKLQFINGRDVCNMTKDEFLGVLQNTRPLNITYEDCGGGPACVVDGPAFPVDEQPYIAQIMPDDDRLGFTVSDYPPSCPIRVQSVDKGSWAERWTERQGDVIQTIGGRNVCNMTKDEFLDLLQNTRPLNVTLKRCHDFGDPDTCKVKDGKDLPVDKPIKSANATKDDQTLDFSVDTFPPDCPVRVAAVTDGGWADRSGIEVGDKLKTINGRDVCNMTKDEFLGILQNNRTLNITYEDCGGGPACVVDGPAFPVDEPPYTAQIDPDDDRLGFTVSDYPPSCPIRVQNVDEGSWAARWTERQGDVIQTIGGRNVCNMTKDEFLNLLQNVRPLNVTLKRCHDFGDPQTCKVSGKDLPVDKPIKTANATKDDQTLDFSVDALPPDCPVRVAAVTAGGWADRSGMEVGDKLKTINGRDVCNMTKDEFLGILQNNRTLNITYEDCGGGPYCVVDDGPAYPVDEPPYTVQISPDDDRLGFTVSDYPPSCPIQVQNVQEGSWAERWTERQGDVIQTIGGRNVCNMTKDDFLDLLRNKRPLNVTLKRCHDFGYPDTCKVNGKDLPVDKPLITVNATEDDPRLDFTVNAYPPSCPVRVRSLTPGKWANRSGLEVGDKLKMINGKDVCDMTQDEFLKALQSRPVNVTFEDCLGGPECAVDGPALPVDADIAVNATDSDPRLDFTVDGYPPQCPVRVMTVTPGKWSDRSGMANGDKLKTINGKDVCNMTQDEFLKALRSRPVNVTFEKCVGPPANCTISGPAFPVDKPMYTVNATDTDFRLDFMVNGYPPECPVRVRSVAPGKFANQSGVAVGDTIYFVNGRDVCNMTKEEFLNATYSRPVNITFEQCGGGPECDVDGPAYPVDKPLVKVNATDEDPRLDFTVDGYPPQCPIRVFSVAPGKWASRSGMVPGDRLHTINGKDVCNMTKDEFLRALQTRPVNVTYEQCLGGPECAVTGPGYPVDKPLYKVNATDDDPRLEFTVTGYPPKCPVQVRSIEPGKWANRSGVVVGDRLHTINGKDVCNMTPDEFLKALRSRPVNVTFERCGDGPECDVDGPAFPVDKPLITVNATEDDPRLDFTVDAYPGGYPPKCPIRVRSVEQGKWANRSTMAMGDTLKFVNGKDVCDMTKDEFLKAMRDRPVNITFEQCGGGPECEMDGPAYPVDPFTALATENDPKLGFDVDKLPPSCPLKITGVMEGSWAERMGVEVGDELLSINGTDVCNMTKDEFLKLTQDTRPILLEFQDCGGGIECNVVGAEYPVDRKLIDATATVEDPKLDFNVTNYPPACPVRVNGIGNGTWADRAGVSLGDELWKINGKSVCNMTQDEFLGLLQDTRPVNLTFSRCVGPPETCTVPSEPALPVDRGPFTVNATDDDPRLNFTVDGYPGVWPKKCPIRIRSVGQGGWADRSGISMGDTLMAINGKEVCDMTKDEFLKALRDRPVNMTVNPCGFGSACAMDGPAFPVDPYNTTVTKDDPTLGFSVDKFPPSCPVRVMAVSGNSWAKRSGVEVGDKVLSINGSDVCNMTKDEFLKLMQDTRPIVVKFEDCGGGMECSVIGPAYPVDRQLLNATATLDDPKLSFTVTDYPPACPVRVNGISSGQWADRSGASVGDELYMINGKKVCDMTKDEFLGLLQDTRPVNLTFSKCVGPPETCTVPTDPAYPVDKPDIFTLNATEADPKLGFYVTTYPPSKPVRVVKMDKPSWADRLGLKEGDTVLAVNGKDISNMTPEEFLNAMQSRPVNVTFARCWTDCDMPDEPAYPVDKQMMNLTATPGDPLLDFNVTDFPPSCPVKVNGVGKGLWADRGGVSPGDELSQINGKSVCNMTKDEFLGLLQDTRPVVLSFTKCTGPPEVCAVPDQPAYPVDKQVLAVTATPDDPLLGFTITDYPPTCPIKVNGVTSGLWADRVGVSVGDELTTINGKSVCDMTKDELLGLTQDTRPLDFTFTKCVGTPETCAVPSDPAYPVDKQLLPVTATPDDPLLGFTITDYPPTCPIKVNSVQSGLWAERVGVSVGDELTTINGKSVCNMTKDELLGLTQDTRPLNFTFTKCIGTPETCAVPTEPAYPVDKQLLPVTATPDDPRLGFTITDYPPTCPIKVNSVRSGLWADRVGVSVGDELTTINGKSVCDMTKDELLGLTQNTRPLDLTFTKCIGGAEACAVPTVPANPVDKPDIFTLNATEADPKLGFYVTSYPPSLPIRVVKMDQPSWADRLGLKEGDTLLAVNGKDVSDMTPAEFLQALQSRPVNVTFARCWADCDVPNEPALPVDKQDPIQTSATATEDGPLGFKIDHEPSTENTGPIIITDVTPNSWAARAGLKPGDELLAVNGIPVKDLSAEDFEKLVQDQRPVQLTVNSCKNGPVCAANLPPVSLPVDKGETYPARASVGDGDLGLTLSGTPPDDIRVMDVVPGSWADRAGIVRGDWLDTINGQRVADMTPDEFNNLMNSRPIDLVFRRDTMYPTTTSSTTTTEVFTYVNATWGDVRLGMEGSTNQGGRWEIAQVEPESWAARLGIRPGDEIIAINGVKVSDMALGEAERKMQVVRPIYLAVKPRPTTTSTRTTSVTTTTVGSSGVFFMVAATYADTQLGLSARFLDEAGQAPVLVGTTESGMWAQRVGLLPGDELISINGIPVSSLNAGELLIKLQVTRPLYLFFKRGGQTTTLAPAQGSDFSITTTAVSGTEDPLLYTATLDNQDGDLGFVVKPAPPKTIKVDAVEIGKWAHRSGVAVGDIVLTVNSRNVSEMEWEEFTRLLVEMRPIKLVFRRQGSTTPAENVEEEEEGGGSSGGVVLVNGATTTTNLRGGSGSGETGGSQTNWPGGSGWTTTTLTGAGDEVLIGSASVRSLWVVLLSSLVVLIRPGS